MLDWKITDAPAPDEIRSEAAPPPPPAPARRGRLRGAWIMVSGVIVLVVVGAGLYSWWTRATTHQAVQQALAQEASAVNGQDIQQIRTLYGTSDSEWDTVYTRWALARQAAPRPLPFLYPLTTTGELLLVDAFAPNVLRAEVAHPFTNVQGQVLTFTTTYFFTFANAANAWQRIEPPANYWGDQRAYLSPYLTILYWEPDQPLVDELGPYLDNLLTQLCAEWDCPADYKYELNFTETLPNPLSLLQPPEEAQPTDPLFFDVLMSFHSRVRVQAFRLASPRVMGSPTNAASLDYFRRALGWQMLLQTSVSIGYHDSRINLPLINPLYFGLLGNVGQRLGLDAQAPDLPVLIDDLGSVDLMRDFNLTTNAARKKLRPAQAFMQRLLRDEPAQTEAELLAALWEYPMGIEWFAAGLDLTPTQAQNRFDETMRDAIQIQTEVRGDFDLALSCNAGPAVLSLDDGVVHYLLSPAGADNYPAYGGAAAWADDGQRIMISGYGFLADLAVGRIQWVMSPQASYVDNYTFLTDDVLVAVNWPSGNNVETQNPALRFHNLRDPHQTPPAIENVWNYAASPDRQWLALAQLSVGGDFFNSASLRLIPAQGGPPLWTGAGAYPSWSPDGQQLTYTEYDSDGRWTAIHRLDLASAESTEIITRAELGSPREAAYGQVVWSPADDWLIFVTGGEGLGYQLWRLRPDGSEAQLLLAGENYMLPPQFSADGLYGAVMSYPPASNGELRIVHMPTGEVVQTINGVQAFAWSTSDQRLAVANFQGIFWLAEPQAKLQQLNNSICYSIDWNPRH